MNKSKAEVILDNLKEGYEQAGYLADISELYSKMADCIKEEGLSEEEADDICYDKNNAFKPESMISHIIKKGNVEGITLLRNDFADVMADAKGWKPTEGIRLYLNSQLNIAQRQQYDKSWLNAKNFVTETVLNAVSEISDVAVKNTIQNILTSDYNSINWLKAEHDLKVWKDIDKDMQTFDKQSVQSEKSVNKAVSKE